MKKKIYLERVLNIFIAFSIIVPLLIISMFAMSYSRTFLIELSKNNNRQIGENLKANIEVFFEEPKNDLKILRDIVISSSTDQKIEELFTIFHVNQQAFNHYLILDKEGSVIMSYPIENDVIGFDFSNSTYFKEIKKGAKEYWSPTYVDTKYDEISIDYALPLGEKVLVGTIHLERLKNILNTIVDEESFIVGITDSTGVYILHSDYTNVEQRFTDPFVNQRDLNYEEVKVNNENYYGTTMDSDYLGWNIVLYELTTKLNSKLNRFIGLLSVIIVISTSIVIFVGNIIIKTMRENLSIVVNKTKEVADGEYGIEIKESKFIEFNEIASSFMQMAEKIENREQEINNQKNEIITMNEELEERVFERTNELNLINEELEITVKNLESTKAQLVESEKLASLSNLTTGLAHEINTPLGIILTVITYLKDESEIVFNKLRKNDLKKDELNQYFKTAKESEKLILDNTTKTVDLINSFKLISTDKSSSDVRETKICEFVKNIILSLEPQMKRSLITLNLMCENEIEILTIPGAIYQVIVNLVLNAVRHGYDITGGVIDIRIISIGEKIEIEVEDYGKGIKENNLNKIFEPFYTTTRGVGGKGLGLNIVYNTVIHKLKGTVICESDYGKGTRFIISLPLSIKGLQEE